MLSFTFFINCSLTFQVHPWVTKEGAEPMPSEPENCNPGPIEVTEEEILFSVRSIPKLDTLILVKAMLKKHSFKNPFSAGSGDASSAGPQGSGSRGQKLSEESRSLSDPDSYECLAIVKRFVLLWEVEGWGFFWGQVSNCRETSSEAQKILKGNYR